MKQGWVEKIYWWHRKNLHTWCCCIWWGLPPLLPPTRCPVCACLWTWMGIMKLGATPGRILGKSCCWKPKPAGWGGSIPGVPWPKYNCWGASLGPPGWNPGIPVGKGAMPPDDRNWAKCAWKNHQKNTWHKKIDHMYHKTNIRLLREAQLLFYWCKNKGKLKMKVIKCINNRTKVRTIKTVRVPKQWVKKYAFRKMQSTMQMLNHAQLVPYWCLWNILKTGNWTLSKFKAYGDRIKKLLLWLNNRK